MVGESEKLSLLSTNIDIYSPSKELICKMHRPMINISTDTWSVEILKENFDKRLVVFIPCYKTSADSKRNSKD